MLDNLGIRLLWFDSMGAKSSSLAIETSKGLVVIDPGAAAMQPSYPLPDNVKKIYRGRALEVIINYFIKAKTIIVTHYHYDHHFLPYDEQVALLIGNKNIFCGKHFVLKNPNKYINESQWRRARIYLEEILVRLGARLEDYLIKPCETEFEDPVDNLGYAMSRDYGEYSFRRKELLIRGKKWFDKLCRLWSTSQWIDEIIVGNTIIEWGEGKKLEYGDTVIEILEPWFHGVEYDKTGWVTPVEIVKNGWRIFYTSDLMGPVIEDYAEYIARRKPDIVVLDGPPTYLFPYMFNRINLRRAVENAITIVNASPKLIIYDHHLLREKNWRKYVEEVYVEARKNNVEILTAAEYYGDKPVIDKINHKH